VTVSQLPRIAVVTPSYNTARYIGPAVRSVLDQSYSNYDYLVMDGGSTDGTLDILRGFGDRLHWVSEKDDGQADAVRRGFERTSGEILAWLNSDDTFSPGAFLAVAEYFAAHPEVDVVYGDATYVDPDGAHIADCVHIEPFSKRRLIYYSDFLVQPATFFRRSAYEAVGGINPKWHWALDYDLWLRLCQKHQFAYLPRNLAEFRWLADNKTATGSFGRLNEIGEIFRSQGFKPPAYIQLERVNLHVRDATTSLRRGKPQTAIADAFRVAKILLMSPRAILSLISPHTWRIVWVGQVLRRRSVTKHAGKTWKGAPCASQT
jgi:glycosyltransferase involved in cell wall biosynthesis